MKRLVLYFGLLMAFQICWRVLVQPSTFWVPHMPWLSGVAAVQRKPAVAAAGATGDGVSRTAGSVVGSVVPHPSANAGTRMDGIQPMCFRRPPARMDGVPAFLGCVRDSS